MALIAIVVDCLLLSFLLTTSIFDCFVVVVIHQSFAVWLLNSSVLECQSGVLLHL